MKSSRSVMVHFECQIICVVYLREVMERKRYDRMQKKVAIFEISSLSSEGVDTTIPGERHDAEFLVVCNF